MIWAACCLGFFGFLCAGKFTVLKFDHEAPSHLSLAEVALDSHSSPSMMSIRIKQSKTDLFCLGVDIFLGKWPHPSALFQLLFPSSLPESPSLAPYTSLEMIPPSPSSAWCLQYGTALSRPVSMKSCMQATCCFRIGAATTAAKNGLEDSLIQTLGR